MSNFWISLLFTIGSGTWLYTKLQKNSGNNTKQSIIASLVLGVITFLVVFLLLGVIIK